MHPRAPGARTKEVEKFILRAGQAELREAFKALMPASEAVEEQSDAELELGVEAYDGICYTWLWLEVELGLISCILCDHCHEAVEI